MNAFLQFLSRAWTYFRGTKRVWRKPPRANLLIIDRGTASPLDEMFAHHNPHIMDIRGESVNMLALFRALPKIHLGAVAYLEAYIDFVKPKLILSRTDNNHTLWQLKRRPKVTYQVALIQNGWRIADSPGGEIKLIGELGSATIDRYFSFGGSSRKAFCPEIDEIFESVGSINLNSFPIMPRKLDIDERLFLVSIFRRKTVADDQGVNEFGGLERSLLKRCKDISVICRSESYEEYLAEEHFYQTAMPTVKKDFLRMESRLASYKWLRSESVILFDMSTLGYEALGLGLRVGCISFQPLYRVTERFGKPLEFGEKGPFWTNDPSEEEVGRILDYLLNVSDEQWELDSGWIRDQLMVHDYGNTKIRAYVEGVLDDSLECK